MVISHQHFCYSKLTNIYEKFDQTTMPKKSEICHSVVVNLRILSKRFFNLIAYYVLNSYSLKICLV